MVNFESDGHKPDGRLTMPAKNIVVLIVAAALFTGAVWFAAPTDTQTTDAHLSGGQKQEIEKLIGQYLRENPTVIVEAIQNLQRRERQTRERAAAQNLVRYRQQLINSPSSPFAGNQDANITVVEFFDYRCPYCKKMLPAIKKLLNEDANIRYVFKEFPILSPASRIASEVALAAWKIDRQRYLVLHAGLMGARGDLNRDRIMQIAKKSGLDMRRLREAMKSPDVAAEIKANSRLARSVGITGTPGFVIGDRVVPGAIDYSTLKKMIAEARAKSG
jgi:protein-disulfide isomerase